MKYLDFEVQPGPAPDPALVSMVHARLLTAVHRAIGAGHPVWVSWPDWQDRYQQFGSRLRAFAAATEVLTLLVTRAMPLIDGGLVSIGRIDDVPAHVQGWQRFVRERRTEKWLSRHGARVANGSVRDRMAVATHWCPMQSLSTGATFTLSIIREADATPPGTPAHPTGYGLGVAVPIFQDQGHSTWTSNCCW